MFIWWLWHFVCCGEVCMCHSVFTEIRTTYRSGLFPSASRVTRICCKCPHLQSSHTTQTQTLIKAMHSEGVGRAGTQSVSRQ